MVIYIDKTVESHGKQYGLTDSERIFFSELASAHQYGKCFLCGDLDSIEWLMSNLEGVHRSIYLKIRNNHPQIISVFDVVDTVLLLSYDSTPSIPDRIKSKVYALEIKNAMIANLSMCCSLVAENLEDCTFYKLIAQRYAYDAKVKGIDISFHYELGGGDTINTVFRKCIVEDKVPTLCLVDGDRKYGPTKKFPEVPAKGETAKKLDSINKQLSKQYEGFPFDLYCLPVHEAENLIPLAILESIAKTSVPDMAKGILLLRKLLSAGLSEAVLYYDFKNGGKRIKTEQAFTYWFEIAEKIDNIDFPPLCSKVLEKAIMVLQGDSKNSIVDVSIDSYLLPIWKHIGLIVFSWGCAAKPIRS